MYFILQRIGEAYWGEPGRGTVRSRDKAKSYGPEEAVELTRDCDSLELENVPMPKCKCVHCGGPAVMRHRLTSQGAWSRVQCVNCGIRTKEHFTSVDDTSSTPRANAIFDFIRKVR